MFFVSADLRTSVSVVIIFNTYESSISVWLFDISLREAMPQAIEVVGRAEHMGLADLVARLRPACARGGLR